MVSWPTTIPTPPQQQITVSAAWVKSMGMTPFIVADKMWYLKEEWINLSITWMAWWDQVFKALTSKSIDLWFVWLVPYGFVGPMFPNIKLITVITNLNDTKLITESSIKNISDLKGKRIWYTKSTASDIGLSKLMRKNWLEKNDITRVNLSPAALPTALSTDTVDWYVAREPNIYNGKKLLSWNVTIFDATDQKYEWYFSLFADESYIQQNRESIEKIKRALIKSQTYIISNPIETKNMMKEFLGMNDTTIDAIWWDYVFRIGIEQKHRDALLDIFQRSQVIQWRTWEVSDISSFISK